MRVIMLTEGGGQIGFGHITRCVSLYQALEVNRIPAIIYINGDRTVEPLISAVNYKIFDWIKRKKELKKNLVKEDVVIIDSYMAEREFYYEIMQRVKTGVYLDDTNRLDYPAGIVVNGAFGADKLPYPRKSTVKYLLGIRYQPMRKVFWDVPDRIVRENVQRILILMGGTDIRNITGKIVRLLADKFPAWEKHVVLKNTESVNELKEKSILSSSSVFFYPGLKAEDLLKIMLLNDIAVSAGGQTLFELVRAGVPTVAVAVADNQLNNIKGMEEAGIIRYAGNWNNPDLYHNILTLLSHDFDKDERMKIKSRGREILDGKGSFRIIESIS